MIPAFPQFKKVAVDDREAVESFTHRFPPYSDFNFTSLWGWDTSEERVVSELNGNLVVRFTDYSTHEPFYSFLGDHDPDKTARELIERAKSESIRSHLCLMPQTSVARMQSSALKVEEDRDNFDYIYSVPAQVRLAGPDFKRSRNFVSKFTREHPQARVEIADMADADAQRQVIVLIRQWEENKIQGDKTYELEHERAAISRIFDTADSHNLILTAIFNGNAMIGFSIDETLPNQYAISHFWKADISHAGIYDFLLHEKSKHLETHGVALMNFEQDLGVAGLRKSKMAYQPHDFLKKYVVSLAE